RARCQTASRSRSKLSWVRLSPMSINSMRPLYERLQPRGLPARARSLPTLRGWSRSYNAAMTFPITPLLPDVLRSLETHPRLVLEAPPGAGKTTQVPLALLDAPWLAGTRIVMLEPRRVAARSAAMFMARQLGEEVGDTVGYRIRFE